MESKTANVSCPKRYRCVLWGGYAWGNVGDELTLAVALSDIRRLYGNSVAIMTRSPGYTRRLFPGIDIIPYEPIARAQGCGDPATYYDVAEQLAATSWAQLLSNCELLYLVGGGYLSDLFHLDWLLLPVFVARACKVTVATGPIGLGPFHYDGWGRRVVEALDEANLVVRDDVSLEFCRNRGLKARHREDDGFRASEVFQIEPRKVASKLPSRRIGINIFHQYGSTRRHDSNAWWAALLKQLDHQNTVLEGFCFHHLIFEDFAVTSECLANAGLDPSIAQPPDFDFRASCARLATYDAIVSSRFHAIVLGNALGIPTYAICDGEYYRSKMQAATKNFNRSALVLQLESSPEEVAASIMRSVHSSAGNAAA
jgi:polysaccharide pyruvyl transferase WcaK-like protein